MVRSKSTTRQKTKRKLRCFISAAAGTNINTVVRVLKQNKVEVVDSVPPAGTELLSAMTKRINQADFVLGVISGDKGSASTLFELGVAIGAGKTVGIIVAPSFTIPTALRGFFSVSADPSDEEALRFNLPIFLKTLQYSAPASVIKTETAPRVVSQTTTVSRTTSQHEHSRIEHEIATALDAFGGITVVESSIAGGRPDFVAWIPELPSDFGNPVVIEAKSSSQAANTQVLRNQLSKFFSIPGLRTVIVTHPDDDHARMEFAGEGYLFVLGLNELKNALQNRNLSELLTGLRNRAAHGDY